MKHKFKALKHKTIENTWGLWFKDLGDKWIIKKPIPYLYTLDITINDFHNSVSDDYDLIEITVNY